MSPYDKNFKEAPLISKCSLWSHQKKAIYAALSYINDYRNKNTNKSCLIHMPTGSGKTGIIAVIARCIPPLKNILVITPRINLRDQLFKDIDSRFFDHLKIFDIDLKCSYSYTFFKAVKERYLRNVEIVEKERTYDPNKFVEDIIQFYNSKYECDTDARVIIRCDNSDSIRQIAKVLKNKRISCIAIHERFKNDPSRPWEYNKVPDPSDIKEKYWIHQFKLLEGIDDYRFRLLALFEPLNSGKAFVQQVGRIVRNPKRIKNQKCYVIDHSNGKQKGFWERFLKYDKYINEDKNRIAVLSREIIEKYIEQQPSFAYLDGDFKEKFDLEEFNPKTDLKIPLKVNFLLKEEGFNIEDFASKLNNDYLSKDFNTRKIKIDNNTYVIAYIYLYNSSLLKNKIFFENKFGVTIIREINKMIGFFDSKNNLPLNEPKYKIGKPIKSKDLKKLFKNHKGCRLTIV